MLFPQKLEEQIKTHSEFIKTGKPASSIAVQERYIDDVCNLVDSFNLNRYIESLSDGWKSVWIYLYPHILEVIIESPQVPETKYEHWIF